LVFYIDYLVSEPLSNSTVAPTGDAAPSQTASAGTKRHLLASLLSALIPGAGQLLLAQRRKGIVLLVVFVVVACCVWPLRFPRFFAALVLISLCWLVLSLYAACAALLEHTNPTDRRTSRWWLLAVPLLTYLGFNAVFTPLFLFAGFRALKFNSSAMEDTFLTGDQFIVDKSFYRDHAVARSDLVVLRRQDYQTVKRVIAIGGDTLEAKNREIMVNGQGVAEPFIRHTLAPGTDPWMDSFGPVTISAGKYFVMGDNRDVSLDSRSSEFGLLDAQAITGRPLYIYRSPIRARVGKKLN
jgi:signal peptidase I